MPEIENKPNMKLEWCAPLENCTTYANVHFREEIPR